VAESDLKPADRKHLDYLKRQADRLDFLHFTEHVPPQQLYAARQELEDFVEKLRKQGYNI